MGFDCPDSCLKGLITGFRSCSKFWQCSQLMSGHLHSCWAQPGQWWPLVRSWLAHKTTWKIHKTVHRTSVKHGEILKYSDVRMFCQFWKWFVLDQWCRNWREVPQICPPQWVSVAWIFTCIFLYPFSFANKFLSPLFHHQFPLPSTIYCQSMSHSLSLLKAFSNLTKSDPNQALMASLQLGLGFHYSEGGKRGEGGVHGWMDGI